MALTLKTVKLSIAYATWGGLGIVLASLLSVFYFREKLSTPAICGIALIVIGTAMCNFFGAGH